MDSERGKISNVGYTYEEINKQERRQGQSKGKIIARARTKTKILERLWVRVRERLRVGIMLGNSKRYEQEE